MAETAHGSQVSLLWIGVLLYGVGWLGLVILSQYLFLPFH